MDFIINHPLISGIVVFFTQIIFVMFRTLNVIYNAEKKRIPTIITGNIIGICWIITISIGVTAIYENNWFIILIAHLLGGTIGNLWGFHIEDKLKRKNNKKILLNEKV